MGKWSPPHLRTSQPQSFRGPSVSTAPTQQAPQVVQTTAFRAFTGMLATKSNPEPIKTLGFGLFDQSGNLVERYAEASPFFWVAMLEALGCKIPESIDDPHHTQAILVSVTGGVVPIVGAQVNNGRGGIEAGMWKMAMIPNAMVSVLQLPEVKDSILVWVQTGMWACTAKVGEKAFPIPEVSGGGALAGNDPCILLGST